MRLIDAIQNVARPEGQRYEYVADCDSICESLGISGNYGYFPDAVNERLKAYPIYNWMCTDEHVGLDAIYLGDEPVGRSYRAARKASYEVEWVSEDAARRVREFILEHVDRPSFAIIDPNQDIGEDFAVHYVTQALDHHGFHNGRPVTALIWYDGLSRGSTPIESRRAGHPYVVSVRFKDKKANCVRISDDETGQESVIPIEEFRLPFNLSKEKE